MPGDAAPLWVLLGQRAGDNRQLLALAEATGLPFVEKRLSFWRPSRFSNAILGATLFSLKPDARMGLQPPWPAVVLASGKRSVPAARWIKKASGGATRLVHVGRPWAPLALFDRIFTTAQYLLPERPNVTVNSLPFAAPPVPGAIREDIAALPRPRLMAIFGGSSRPLVLDPPSARALIDKALAQIRTAGGSLLVATSPRTSPDVVAAIREALASTPAPHRLAVFGESGPDDWKAFLAGADAFVVTEDSVAMVAEAAMLGRPVTLQALPRRYDRKHRIAKTLGRGWTRPLFGFLNEHGLLMPTRDTAAYMDRLRQDGLLDGGDAARLAAERELSNAAAIVVGLAKAGFTRPA